MARGFDDVPDSGGYDSLREDELWELYKLSDEAKGNWVRIRILPTPMLPIKKHWVHIITKKGQATKVPKMCVSFNPDDQSSPLDGRVCPFCKLDHTKDTGVAENSLYYYVNAIIRDEQDNQPRKVKEPTKAERKSGYKDINSKSWTPVRVVQLTGGLARKIKEMKQGNKDKKKNPVSVADAKYGCDIEIKYNPKASGEAKYSIQKGERTPLTEEELAYLVWDLEDFDTIYDALGRLDSKAALAEFKGMKINGSSSSDDDEDDDDDDDEGVSVGKKKSKKSKSKKKSDDDDDDDDDEPKSKKSKAKKKSRFDDDDDDDD